MQRLSRVERESLFDDLVNDLKNHLDRKIGVTDNDRIVISNMMIALGLRMIADAIEDQ